MEQTIRALPVTSQAIKKSTIALSLLRFIACDSRASNHSGTFHCAPTPALVAADGRLYRAFESSEADAFKGMAALIISTIKPVTKTTNLTDPAVVQKRLSGPAFYVCLHF